MDNKFVSYLRVSTDRQGCSELGLEAPRKTVQTTSTAATGGSSPSSLGRHWPELIAPRS